MASRLLLTLTILLPLAYWEGVWVKGEGLNVTITVDYTPPPDATELGPNDYWAASGPMNVTCLAAGSTGPVTYQWSSTCRECPFFVSNPKNQSVIVPVVSSGYTGNATCLVMDGATGSTKSTHIELIVVGAGLVVSPDDNYVQNNSLTFSSESNVTCYSGSVAETNVGSFIGVDGGVIHDHVGHPTKGSVSLTLQNTEIQGIYTCQIPDQNKNMRDVNFGVYPIGFNTPPTIDDLVFTNGSSSSTLTCTSSGSPATTVTWMKDGQPLTVDGSTYQLTQTVTNRAESTYENVLTIHDELADIIDHTYTCRVGNILGSASRDIPVGVPPTTAPPPPEPTGPNKTDHTAIEVGIAVGASLIAIALFITAVTVCFALKKRKPGTMYHGIQSRRSINECTTFVSSASDSQDEPIYDVPVVCHHNYNLDGHHQGYDTQAPVGRENDVQQRQDEQARSHAPSGPREPGYGSVQSSDYEQLKPVYAQIYRHEEDSGRYDEVQHYENIGKVYERIQH